MIDQRDYIALDWLAGEISTSLSLCVQVLDEYQQNHRADIALERAEGLLSQVQGSLRMIEFSGAQRLLGEMLAVVATLDDDTLDDIARERRLEALRNLCDEVPAYLIRLRRSRRELPASLIMMFNEIRGACGQPLLSSTLLFTPQLQEQLNYSQQPTDLTADSFIDLSAKLRKMYQLAVAAWQRGEAPEKSVIYMAKVAGRVTRLCAGTPQESLWLAALALFEGLENESIASSIAVESILERLDSALGLLAELGRDGALSVNRALCKDILFYVSCSPSDSRFILEAQRIFVLNKVVSDGDNLSASGEAEKSDVAVSDAISAALTELGQRLESESYQAGHIDLKEVADAVAVMGYSDVLYALDAMTPLLAEELTPAQQYSAAQTLQKLAALLVQTQQPDVAPALLNNDPEAQLQLNSALQAVSIESRDVLVDAQERLLSFVAEQFRKELLSPLPEQLQTLASTLLVAGLSRPAQVLGQCAKYMSESLLLEDEKPSWQKLDCLADAIAAVDYYLERIATGPESEDGALMSVAEDCVERLGYPVPAVEESFAPLATVIPWRKASDDVADADALPSDDEVPTTNTDGSESIESASEIDPEIAAVFLEEAAEVLAQLEEVLPKWRADIDSLPLLTEARRGFHTLKGSGRMVQAEQISELSWAIENMLNRVIDGGVQMDLARLELIDGVTAALPRLLEDYRLGQPQQLSDELFELQQRASVLAGQHDLLAADTVADDLAETDETPATLENELSEPARSLETFSEQDASSDGGSELPAPPADDSLLGIFIIESDTHLHVLEDFLADVDSFPASLSDEVQRSLHTLKGASNMAEVWAIANLIAPLEALVKELRSMRIGADKSLVSMMADIVAYSRQLTESLRHQPVTSLRTPADLLQRLEALSSTLLDQAEMSAFQRRDGQLAPGVLNHFLSTYSEALFVLADELAAPALPTAQKLRDMAPELGAFAYRAEELSVETVAELSQSLQVLLGHASDPVPSHMVSLAADAVEHLLGQLNQIAADQAPQESAELLNRLRDYDANAQPSASTGFAIDDGASQAHASTDHLEQDSDVDAEEDFASSIEAFNATTPLSPVDNPHDLSLPPALANPGTVFDDDVDQEILDIFLEEAGDLLEGIDQAIHLWADNVDELEQLDRIQRHLHTLKGGARLVGLSQLGDVSHEFEAALTDAAALEQTDKASLLARIHQYQDQLVAMIEATGDTAEKPPQTDAVQAVPTNELSEFDFAAAFGRKVNQQPAENLLVAADKEEVAVPVTARAPQEMIKVSSQLLEKLINLAGETSISRARSEEQVSEIHASLEEMEITVERLQDQVRRMDMETEAQILFRQEQVGGDGADGFDPLEFDRYSKLQQYSRSLLESASDLVDLRSTLLEKSRDMETLLLQQSRIHGDLQEGLMRSQMVHFSRMVPRLRRGVRQIASELGKNVDFKVYNAEGEMDRRVLERIIPALEHMLRNAIGHGIEDESTRLAAEKAPVGEIAMRFDRQGGDVVIAISDDGGGIDLQAVRAKAQHLGLITEDAVLSTRQLLEYIFHAGFSTASSVTQISGRGVGMDVVRNEIKQLGGSIDIRTEAGRGTRFEVRLPFTVSVNRALMVSVAGEAYAVPLNNIEGIVRVSPYELEVYYQDANSQYEYAGQQYNLRYLGQLVGHAAPHMEGQVDPKPVLLIRNAEPPTAVQVDALLGSQEVVVKTLGPQFASVPSLSGATVLGDGRVVVILDVLASIRDDVARRLMVGEQALLPSTAVSGNRLVMVVDDSVTVRKVTSRFLERQQMDVLLARDGMEAVTVLQDIERLPDVILLDIEMPRMDGFEVLVRLRGNPRTQAIPVVMISSRSGDKHRERAASLGVTHFLGKPYQETQVLRAIQDVSDEKVHE